MEHAIFNGLIRRRDKTTPIAKPQCEKCGDLGYWFDGDKMIICPCEVQKMVASKKRLSGITPHLAKNTFSDFSLEYYPPKQQTKAQAALKAAREFTEDVIAGKNPDGLLFLGAVGGGKTYLASAIIGQLIESGIEAQFVVVSDFLDAIRESYKQDSQFSERELTASIRNVPVLAFDDLGADNNTDFAVKTVFGVLNHRLNYELPTIITTNLSYQQIESVYGSRICSRLTEMCRFFQLESDKDIRLAKKLKERG